MQAKQHLPHIDGLRTLAIVGIVFFHLLKRFPDGYLGVDIFLVISGYLLFRNYWVQDTRFSFSDFLKKKVLRLWPATIAITLPCVVLAMLLFPFEKFQVTLGDAIATILGGANLFYDYKFDGYFSALSHMQRPLVHTWYLSLIFQVYLISGVIILISRRFSVAAKCLLFAICIACSILICYLPDIIGFFTPFHTNFSTYYWTSGRLWMVCAGGLVPLLPDLKNSGRCRNMLGLSALILLLMFTFNPWAYSFLWTVEPLCVFCSMLCIKYADRGLCGRLLNNRICSCTGKYSFSLYLVHWPIFVLFSAYFMTWTGSAAVKAGALLCVAVATFFFYHWIEKRRCSITCVGILWFLSLSALAWLSASRISKGVFYKEIDDFVDTFNRPEISLTEISSGKLYETLPEFRPQIYVGGVMNSLFTIGHYPLLYHMGDSAKTERFLLIGDSHAESLPMAMDELLKRNHWSGAYLNTYVIPADNYYSGGEYCQRWDSEKATLLLSYLRSNPEIDTVIISNYWNCRITGRYRDWDGNLVHLDGRANSMLGNIRSYIQQIRACGKRVVVLTDIPSYKDFDPKSYISIQMMMHEPLDERKITCTKEEYDGMNEEINDFFDQMEREGICRVVHLENVFFKDGPARAYRDGVLYYNDPHHLTLQGARMVLGAVENQLREILDARPQPGEGK
ncbi:MAG: acyltransferase family protein [Akkermansia sp.]|nr:acyltransferase family protein [Akkermansia sp.]